MKYSLLALFTLVSTFTFAQITGTVTSNQNEPLPVVNIFIEHTYTGTTTNNDGNYLLDISKTGDYTITFQYLGYKTLKKTVTITKLPFVLDAVLAEEDINLDEVVINSDENPANIIIRQTIAKRKDNLNKLKSFKADFYSRGLLKMVDVPEKVLGQEVGDFDGALDSTRTGIVYLSETISKLEYQAPKPIKETIIASKVSGDSNGFSFNNATDVEFNFYQNTFELGSEIVSPISDFAFNYYKYKLVGTFYDDLGHLINKIELLPKRKNDKAFGGFIYIVEDQWSLFGTDVTLTGQQAQIPAVDVFNIKQTFTYYKTNQLWVKTTQIFDFKFGIFGFNGDGRFTAAYSDYELNPNFDKKNFTREVLSFEDNANKKDSIYWETKRPVPLTNLEANDYVRRDSIQLIRESKPYLDSIDSVHNAFKIGDILGGYSYNNSYKKTYFSISSPISKLAYNTVQGWNGTLTADYRKYFEDDSPESFKMSSSINYGASDDRLRATGTISYRFDKKNRANISLSGGSKVEQFNPDLSSLPFLNTFYSLTAEKNYLKIYNRNFAQLNYSQELLNGLHLYSNLSYNDRKPLFNTTDQAWYPQDNRDYTSNNPINPSANGVASFDAHNIMKLNVNTRINFGQNYMSYPFGKYNLPNSKIPTLYLGYEKGFGSSNSNYNFDQFKGLIHQSLNLGNKGDLTYLAKGGIFNNADNIAFIDYHHFSGNQTNLVIDGNYINAFKILPYYALSTNKAYAEIHAEHNFKGYILNKIPLLNKLNFNLVAGFNAAATKENKPYTEYSLGLSNLGWGKMRFLRVDYVRTYQGSGLVNDTFMFGFSF
ncbi:DUF5686 and carboxypeptidase regulatory-like domain-containing protein [Olleya sp. HaHaR_3_96]|uniref:DUF5686 and carboxypeptidase regulatory-like domain-containing protein n=1 Tax=Olleya sp. HaHaR_3_96 TaxID=2745560 RepID=UPI001C4F94D8|nr:DUF5686 and carboxypeptidase regulatory-like domain-containing protein [Olleya sp. HaHaR_3_96]QXP58275.1 carboxypeptidase-like regulatory domain-containing protein [Olleya sp. HaHaR_3_96]